MSYYSQPPASGVLAPYMGSVWALGSAAPWHTAALQHHDPAPPRPLHLRLQASSRSCSRTAAARLCPAPRAAPSPASPTQSMAASRPPATPLPPTSEPPLGADSRAALWLRQGADACRLGACSWCWPPCSPPLAHTCAPAACRRAVSRACLGKPFCTVNASVDLFGNPCQDSVPRALHFSYWSAACMGSAPAACIAHCRRQVPCQQPLCRPAVCMGPALPAGALPRCPPARPAPLHPCRPSRPRRRAARRPPRPAPPPRSLASSPRSGGAAGRPGTRRASWRTGALPATQVGGPQGAALLACGAMLHSPLAITWCQPGAAANAATATAANDEPIPEYTNVIRVTDFGAKADGRTGGQPSLPAPACCAVLPQLQRSLTCRPPPPSCTRPPRPRRQLGGVPEGH